MVHAQACSQACSQACDQAYGACTDKRRIGYGVGAVVTVLDLRPHRLRFACFFLCRRRRRHFCWVVPTLPQCPSLLRRGPGGTSERGWVSCRADMVAQESIPCSVRSSPSCKYASIARPPCAHRLPRLRHGSNKRTGMFGGQARHSRHAAGDIEALVGHREERSNPMAEPHALEGSKSSADPAGPNQGCRRIGNSRGIRVRISEPM